MSVSPVSFENRDGLQLFGMLHKPDSGVTKKQAIVLLSPGVKMRVAPHRLYVNMARKFEQLGYMVFRFDFYALGDAAGNLDEKWLADVYNSVALGKYIDDTVDAIDWLEKEHGVSQVITAGLCGGALTGLLTAKDDKRITGLLGLGIPCVLDSSESDRVKNLTKGQLNKLGAGYFRNMLSWQSWIRLLTFKSDYRIIFRSMKQMLLGKVKKNKPAKKKENSRSEAAKVENSNINPLFTPAFFALLESSRKMLLIFSGADRLFWEFDEKFAEPNGARLSDFKDTYEVHIVKDANHIFSNKAWQDEMLQHSINWLNNYFDQ